MDPESKKLLEETFELEKENNRILQSMKRSMQVARLMTIIYWVFIVGSAVGAYYLIEPYVDEIKAVYGGASDVLGF